MHFLLILLHYQVCMCLWRTTSKWPTKKFNCGTHAGCTQPFVLSRVQMFAVSKVCTRKQEYHAKTSLRKNPYQRDCMPILYGLAHFTTLSKLVQGLPQGSISSSFLQSHQNNFQQPSSCITTWNLHSCGITCPTTAELYQEHAHCMKMVFIPQILLKSRS